MLGLGPNLFYNSPMEAFVLVCRSVKAGRRKGRSCSSMPSRKSHRERAQSFLKPEHQAKILNAYRDFADQPGFAAVVD